MLLRTVVLGLSVVALITGCSSTPQSSHRVTAEAPKYDAALSARIRILTGNGTWMTAFRPGESCYRNFSEPDTKKVEVRDRRSAKGGYVPHSVVIGMPKSPRPQMNTDDVAFKDIVREYVVPASRPLAIGMLFGEIVKNKNVTCTPPWVTFTPQPGQDYDIFMGRDARMCWVAVRRINEHGMDEPVKVTIAPKCDA